MTKDKRKKVILRRCDSYNEAVISGIIKESLTDLGIKPNGKTLIKPNVVTANKAYIFDSYTHPTVIGSAVDVLRSMGAADVTVGESGGYGIPSRLFLKESGYFKMGKEKGVRVVDFNEEKYYKVPLKKGMWHKSMRVAKSLHNADFKVWMPKLKYHICCTITNALKLNIGILTHAERMLYHDDRLNEKIVDLLEIGFPNVVISDAVKIAHGYESAPKPFDLGLILVANDPLAADAVGAKILGFKPEDVIHLVMASERGYGSIADVDIEVTGDVTIEELAKKTKGIVSEYQDIHKVDTPIKFYTGNDPDRGRFCYGGCLAALKGCLGTIDARRPGSVKNARPGGIVTGVYKGDVIHPDGPVLLIGDCTKVLGKLEAKKVKRIKGCPLGTKMLFVTLPRTFGMPSPLFDPRDAVLFIYNSVVKGMRKVSNIIFTRK
ncbi:MAG: DUF362 domain-containing protein [Deltaproteobacteria bacterium]|uniref:DUF362 domain-containing protein n=1 Tax=Candidatus Zymogenus saltonus TaxID=2844893 RepID=A0A9D8KI82_9DELT|nr:DUF362 domain-containing protein [Candidatus Zymogenus saltonus]